VTAPPRTRVVILGAAGRDFHNFNTVYRDDPATEVVAFTATQIPGIAGRRYPTALAGPLYPDGIPIADEADLEAICRRHAIDRVVFAYSDVTHAHVMHLAARALSAGADYALLGPARTMLAARVPVVAVSAVRTGCGKSQIARFVSRRLSAAGMRVAALRHPMPYGDLARQRVQRFASAVDLDAARCTLEEREEYEPHIAAGGVVFAGVDYAAILAAAEAEAEVIVWDGGNNDFPFLKPDLHLVVVDALRPDQLATHHPGETVLRMADCVIVNKADAAPPEAVAAAITGARAANPRAAIVRAAGLGRPARADGNAGDAADDPAGGPAGGGDGRADAGRRRARGRRAAARRGRGGGRQPRPVPPAAAGERAERAVADGPDHRTHDSGRARRALPAVGARPPSAVGGAAAQRW